MVENAQEPPVIIFPGGQDHLIPHNGPARRRVDRGRIDTHGPPAYHRGVPAEKKRQTARIHCGHIPHAGDAQFLKKGLTARRADPGKQAHPQRGHESGLAPGAHLQDPHMGDDPRGDIRHHLTGGRPHAPRKGQAAVDLRDEAVGHVPGASPQTPGSGQVQE